MNLNKTKLPNKTVGFFAQNMKNDSLMITCVGVLIALHKILRCPILVSNMKYLDNSRNII